MPELIDVQAVLDARLDHAESLDEPAHIRRGLDGRHDAVRQAAHNGTIGARQHRTPPRTLGDEPPAPRTSVAGRPLPVQGPGDTVDGKNECRDGQTGERRHPPGVGEVVTAVGDQGAPLGGGRRGAVAK